MARRNYSLRFVTAGEALGRKREREIEKDITHISNFRIFAYDIIPRKHGKRVRF